MAQPRESMDAQLDFYSLPATRYSLLFLMQLSHRDMGGAGNPPLVILHGLLGSSRNWQTVGKDLAAKYHVLALDLRNHGASPHESEMSYSAMLEDVIAWLDQQGLPRASIMGHSMGGKFAMLLACRHADRVERLIVVDIAPKDYRWEAHRAEFAAMNELDLEHLASRAEAELRFEARVDDWAMRKFLVTNLERNDTGGWRWQINLPALTAALPALEKNALSATDVFRGPTKFIVGGRSRYVHSEDAVIIRQHFPAATIEVIADSGHNPHIEQRAAFVQAALA
jgi:esterase